MSALRLFATFNFLGAVPRIDRLQDGYHHSCMKTLTMKVPDEQLAWIETDFWIYRRFDRQVIPLVAPGA